MKAICKGGWFRTAKGTTYFVQDAGRVSLTVQACEGGPKRIKLSDFNARVASGQYVIVNRTGR